VPPDAWEQILNTNLRGVFYTIRAFAPLMIKARSGHIINISSLAGKRFTQRSRVRRLQVGLNGLNYSVAEELRGQNIRVSVICPGSVNTELSPTRAKIHEDCCKPEDVATRWRAGHAGSTVVRERDSLRPRRNRDLGRPAGRYLGHVTKDNLTSMVKFSHRRICAAASVRTRVAAPRK